MGFVGAGKKLLDLLQVFFCIHRQFNHTFQQVLLFKSGIIVKEQFLTKEAANVTKFADFVLTGINKISVPLVDDNDVFVYIESRTPHFPRCSTKGVSGQSLVGTA
jgi:hypothetical protein